MKNLFLFVLLTSFSTPMFTEAANAQSKNELPLYGNQAKTPAEIANDQQFVKEALASAGTKEKAVDHLIMRGQEAVQRREPGVAIKRFNQAYLIDPSDYRIYWGLGAVMGQEGKFSEAIELFKKAEEKNSKDARLLSDHGFALVSEVVTGRANVPGEFVEQRFGEAEKLYRRGIEISPKEALPYSRLAVLMLYKGDIKQCRALVDQSKKLGGEGLDPRFVEELERREGKSRSRD